jgi:ABC-type glycerol-3-phosphate transport system permease component
MILPLCLPSFLADCIFAFTLAQHEIFYALFSLGRSSALTALIDVMGELVRGDGFYMGSANGRSAAGLLVTERQRPRSTPWAARGYLEHHM